MIWTLNAKKLEAERRKIGRGLLYNWTWNTVELDVECHVIKRTLWEFI